VSADLRAGGAQATVRAVRVQTVFHVTSDRQAEVVAAKMIDRAHEIANLPECECDVDVGIDRPEPDGASASDSGGMSAPRQSNKL
jgi:hypothetical protein